MIYLDESSSDTSLFLVKEGGLNSGFMIAHCTAAALVSENKTLCHPASVDSLSTSAGTEVGFSEQIVLRLVIGQLSPTIESHWLITTCSS